MPKRYSFILINLSNSFFNWISNVFWIFSNTFIITLFSWMTISKRSSFIFYLSTFKVILNLIFNFQLFIVYSIYFLIIIKSIFLFPYCKRWLIFHNLSIQFKFFIFLLLKSLIFIFIVRITQFIIFNIWRNKNIFIFNYHSSSIFISQRFFYLWFSIRLILVRRGNPLLFLNYF